MLYVLCGIPASGKTTYSQHLAKQLNAKLYCYDDMPQSGNPKKVGMLHKQMWSDILQDLQRGFDVVCDDLHTTKKQRADILEAVKDIDCEKILVVMKTSIDVCLTRNGKRERQLPEVIIKAIYNKYETPTENEGWDKIVVKDNNPTSAG